MTHTHTAIPDRDTRAALNAALLTTGADTSFWDHNRSPAPWPDDIEEWRPATAEPITFEPGEKPLLKQDPLEDQPLHHVRGLDPRCCRIAASTDGPGDPRTAAHRHSCLDRTHLPQQPTPAHARQICTIEVIMTYVADLAAPPRATGRPLTQQTLSSRLKPHFSLNLASRSLHYM